MGHIHLNVSDVEAQTRFWVTQFDATPWSGEGLTGVQVNGMKILFNKAVPTHLSDKTVLDHFGFKVRSRDEMVQSCRTAGYVITKLFKGSEGFPNAYVVGPDGINVELQEDTSLKVRAVAQHMHYLLPDYLALRTWYIEKLGMTPTHRGTHDSADIPGMNLTFAPSHARTLGTKGGIIDHIGFEVPGQKETVWMTDPAGILIELSAPLR
jgi:catechol 2,3-dioxygenase-like lactoylglutathione lyase family enzyme